ncbi:multifunctional oxoglutarate decarboxylase/oxoglutarate dehydrogenase thiamine pyrophosphate-binding subunit/dihydrolipoyllysine-residue succinyltransferase subunit [Micrococcus porci]|uniref:multifunctional oxoglutarate decarboxylase/oxoglutarate dehydrogenase thiamine pyrophosphate-binding subunit/dihydrolipoyllysine-residue succinyltransferase subunit n=1 Tax=Micrococcus TaxID=1269 RepID=UPI001CCB84B1|nr:multifunctional oxoglutarate decarboxylase/oxoglutarate dehydrogenase thiamine pyrophosphate-binding subunit/dihydrolipoyllysine-residue succinyltransferase subunit [Micrococcus porci]MCG7421822.1 multifunctional oxoglutarate decarboxylase/oxoglutarate dehydrogenase thiamine pyrophosphate-binding subunit/dihydrolipoyllysine-residue succinyltransferase subunit [Micrococcus sp. ACRRV]UBH24268.1 multifunctional oxoglutarate decarboxylase/oxoglutarate dehydrogenase thiamine pyrophosphate-binding s
MPELTSDRLSQEFPGNEDLVAQIYRKYREDQGAVDRQWAQIFARLEASQPQPEPAAAAPKATSSATAEPAPAVKPAVKRGAATPADPQAAAKKSGPTDVSAPAQRKRSVSEAVPSEPARDAAAGASEKQDKATVLKGMAKAVATNMDASLSMPTATTVRDLPAKLLIDNRTVINSHLARTRGGKVSFTHLIGYAVVRALKAMPSMNTLYEERDGKPTMVEPAHVNFGLAIDLPKPDGTRALVVPNIKAAETLSFRQFWEAYDDLVKRGRANKLTMDDYAGTTVSLTNPGGIGTVHSVPRLSKGQAAIIGVGALTYPAAFQGAAESTLNSLAISKTITLTSTYDHRVIQGAGSGEFLKLIHGYLLGEDGFYDDVFHDLRIPYEPVRWAQDVQVNPEEQIGKVARIQQLIHAYRDRGHLLANVDPLEYRMPTHPDLDIREHGLTLWDLDREWPTGGFGGADTLTLRRILGVLRDAYCRTVGVEYMHIQNPAERAWFQDKLERPYEKPSREEQLRILGRLNAAEAFETFLQTKYIGQKRFSLEGGESLIPLLDSILGDAADEGLDEVAIGMAHRGRLNVLTNIAGKTYSQVFREFEGATPGGASGSGDVKYHMGTEGTFVSDAGNSTRVYLAANPSHLEAVDPVLEGVARAKQDRLEAAGESGAAFPVLPILVHGDAAFAGQGVVTEVLNLSQLPGYRTGGTIHVVVNNQVGFTTSPAEGRSSVYATDVAKTIQAPILHVNGDEPESVLRVARLAYEYRQRFHKDVVIDLVCYRRRGHNEGDDPSMTQPRMYTLIEQKRSTRKLYVESLVGRGDITQEEADTALKDYQQQLERVFAETHAAETGQAVATTGLEPARDRDAARPAPSTTAISPDTLRRIGDVHLEVPEDFTVHPKLSQLLEKRAKMAVDGGIDWGFAELAAFGSLLMEGVPVRLSGQDSQRGTFTQRHSVFHDRVTDETWTPLNHLSESEAPFWVYNSLLSEYAVLGFEYGYSVERSDALVLWEAQFGDFINGAQTMIDEFISSAEQKWSQNSSVVLLLPHGYEGQGPDHSSARIERFLQMCAEDNMRVVNPSHGANHFHLLREQAYSRPRRPLVVFTPKQLLRLKAAADPVEAFTQGGFRKVIGDASVDAAQVERVILVSGRLYYDLLARREKSGDTSTAIVRVEQLYPLPAEEIRAELAKYPGAQVRWVQDEPANQGPWPFMALNLLPQLDREVTLVSRPALAATSAGTKGRHDEELSTLLDTAFGA